jgi:hypothetical protein
MKIAKIFRSGFFWAILLVFLLHVVTYPSIHHIIDEYTYLKASQKVCNLNFSDFFGKKTEENVEFYSHNTPMYALIYCLASPIHSFDVERAEIVTFGFLMALTAGWYYSIPKNWKVDRKKVALLIFSNSLLWVYGLRALKDVPLAFFLSLGIFHLYLYLENKKMKNYYTALILIATALMLKESAVLYLPIFFAYLLIKRGHKLKDWIFLILPAIPYLIFTAFQYVSGFPVAYLFTSSTKFITPFTYQQNIPYASLPTLVFMIGIFGPGFLSVVLRWKDQFFTRSQFNGFLKFSLVMYIVWELVFDILLFGNMPRYHTVIIPFLSVVIAESADRSKKFKILFYLTAIYSVLTGFLISYYFHVKSLEIWMNSPRKFIESILKR